VPQVAKTRSGGPTPRQHRARVAQRVRRSSGRLVTTATARMEAEMAWFRELSAEDRSWIGLIVEAGVQSFVTWYRDPEATAVPAAGVSRAAPRTLTRVGRLLQPVELVRLTPVVGEEAVADIAAPDYAQSIREAVT